MTVTLAQPGLRLADGCWTLGGADLCGGLDDTVPGTCQTRLDVTPTSNGFTALATVNTFLASPTVATLDCDCG